MADLSTSSNIKKRNVQSSSSQVEELSEARDHQEPKKLSKHHTLKPPTLWQRAKFPLKILFVFAVIVGIITYYRESPINPKFRSLPSPRALEGPLAPNTRLLDGIKLLDGKIRGPETLALYKGKIYTGTYDGGILRITNDTSVRSVARLGTRPCGSPAHEPTCGRPMGLTIFDSDIYVMDSYMGLFQISLNGNFKNLVANERTYDRNQIKFGSDVTKFQGKNKDIFFIDSCSAWNYNDQSNIFWEVENCGRLMWFNPINNMSNIAMDKLYYPTGIQFAPDEEFMLISEATRFRIIKYYLNGHFAGGFKVFADNLPGAPMKVRPSSSGGYWVALAHVGGRVGGPFPIIDFLYSRPWLRTLITKFIAPKTLTEWLPRYGMIIELDQEGNIIQSLHDPSGEMVSSASSVLDTGDALYIGSAEKNYILKVGVSKSPHTVKLKKE